MLALVLMFTIFCRDSTTMHGLLIVGMEQRLNQIEAKLSDVDARASEEADCATNERDLDRFIYSGMCFVLNLDSFRDGDIHYYSVLY